MPNSRPLSPTTTHHNRTPSPILFSVPVRAEACHGSSDVSCLLSRRLVVAQQHIQQGLCNPHCLTAWQVIYCRGWGRVRVSVCWRGLICYRMQGIRSIPQSAGACVHRKQTCGAKGRRALLSSPLSRVWSINMMGSLLEHSNSNTGLLPPRTYPRILYCSSSGQVNNSSWHERKEPVAQLFPHRYTSLPVGSREQYMCFSYHIIHCSW